ncbi:MAG: 1-hydroxycarotenoid 3,4-desaturase CrtD [Pseudomonadota bacterium]
MRNRTVIIGSGIAGLSAAVELSARGEEVLVLESAACVGGKMRQINIHNQHIDSGPTVLTMRWVFDAIFQAAGTRLEDHVKLKPLNILARHAWTDGSRMDLFSDIDRSADEIGRLAGPAEARGYRDFCAKAARVYSSLESTFINAQQPSMLGLVGRMGRQKPSDIIEINPHQSLWDTLGRYFKDKRLHQLFARYATYCGSSPYSATATLMLVAHVERQGVWHIEGGMHKLAQALKNLAENAGATFRFNTQVKTITHSAGRVSGVVLEDDEEISASSIVFNGDAAALACGLLGTASRKAVTRQSPRVRSLSAITWSTVADPKDFPLSHHNVFFSDDYRAEFTDILTHKSFPRAPTVYICAQDRANDATAAVNGQGEPTNAEPERLLCLVNAPPVGDQKTFEEAEIKQCQDQTRSVLKRCGLDLDFPTDTTVITTPADFEALFPGTGGALYGRHAHGMTATFQRPGSRSKLPGLYLAGGSVHPGPGVPMAALSGRLATASLLADRASTRRFHKAATFGGTSTA